MIKWNHWERQSNTRDTALFCLLSTVNFQHRKKTGFKIEMKQTVKRGDLFIKVPCSWWFDLDFQLVIQTFLKDPDE